MNKIIKTEDLKQYLRLWQFTEFADHSEPVQRFVDGLWRWIEEQEAEQDAERLQR